MFKFRWFTTTVERLSTLLDNYDFGVDMEANEAYRGDGRTLGGVLVGTAGEPGPPGTRASSG